uniref:Uncharacterized protein n=1 Tax=Sphaerodactylus townsendi TaxID=933632 RepID=A0ACB8FNR9_9SAUR
MARSQNAKDFGHGSFPSVPGEHLQKNANQRHELKYEALIGKPSTVTYRYAEHIIKQQIESRGWMSPLHHLYAIGDINPMADVYGYKPPTIVTFGQSQAEVNVDSAMASDTQGRNAPSLVDASYVVSDVNDAVEL